MAVARTALAAIKDEALTPDGEVVKTLSTRARSLELARKGLKDGACRQHAADALEEAEAILRDAAEVCRDLPGARF